MKASAPPPVLPLSRDALSDHFLRICAQLDTLQPPSATSVATTRDDDLPTTHHLHIHTQATSSSTNNHCTDGGGTPSGLLPSRARIAGILQRNQQFRPVDETQPRRRPPVDMSTTQSPRANRHQTSNTTTAVFTPSTPPTRDATSSASAAALRVSARAPGPVTPLQPSTTVAPTSPEFVLMPVGGRARVFQTQELTRAKRSMKKRSHALTDLQAATATLGGSTHTQHQPNHDPLTTNAKQALIAELVRCTHFSTPHIFHMSRKFKAIAGASQSVISFPAFRAILSDDVASMGFVPTGESDAESTCATSTATAGTGTNTETGEDNDALPPPPHATTDLKAISATIATSESFLRRLFQMFDRDGDGKIDFREFVVGLNGFVQGSLEDKVDALFEVYQSQSSQQLRSTEPLATDNENESADGGSADDVRGMTVAISDLLALFQGDRHLYQELMHCVDEYFVRGTSGSDQYDGSTDDHDHDQLEEDGDKDATATIHRDDFVAASLADPRLLETITRPTPSLMFSEDASLRERLKALVDRRGIRWRTMLAIQQRIQLYLRQSLSQISAASDQLSSTMTTTSDDWRLPIAPFLQILEESAGLESTTKRTDGTATSGLDAHGGSSEANERNGDDTGDPQRLLRAYLVKPSIPGSATPSTPSAGGLSSMLLLDVRTFLQDLAVVLLHPTVSVSVSVSVSGPPNHDSALDAHAKAQYYFDLFDLDRDGQLTRTELVSGVCASFAHFGPHLNEVVRVLESEDVDQDGELTKAQYLRAARRSPLILASLYTCL